MHTNLFAYTAPGFEPQFVSLNRHDDGKLVLTVRGAKELGGHTVDVELSRDTAEGLYVGLMRHLVPTDKA